MSSFVPRGPYSEAELERLYPKSLHLQLVQIVRPIRQSLNVPSQCRNTVALIT